MAQVTKISQKGIEYDKLQIIRLFSNYRGQRHSGGSKSRKNRKTQILTSIHRDVRLTHIHSVVCQQANGR